MRQIAALQLFHLCLSLFDGYSFGIIYQAKFALRSEHFYDLLKMFITLVQTYDMANLIETDPL